MAESDEAASIQTVTDWVASGGRFWGNDEHMARYDGSTHHRFDKNPEYQPIANGDCCRECRKEHLAQRWKDMPKEAYTSEAFPLHLYDADRYFFDAEDLV